MSEGLRTYFQSKGIRQVISSYGASDLELNIASENDFTISLRKFLIENEALRKELLVEKQVIPMVFLFNPADFYIESNTSNELLISICRPGYVAPKIRYNIKDKGQVMKYSQFLKFLEGKGINKNALAPAPSDLP